MCGDEILQNGQAFAQVCKDGRFDDLAGWLSHQTAHTGDLADGVLFASGSGVGHYVYRVKSRHSVISSIIPKRRKERLLQVRFQTPPDVYDPVVPFTVGHTTFLVSVRHFLDVFLRLGDEIFLVLWYYHIVNTDRNTRPRCIFEPQILEFVQKLSCATIAVLVVAHSHKLNQIVRFQLPVAERDLLTCVFVNEHELLRKYLVEYDTPGCSLYHLTVDSVLYRGMESECIGIQGYGYVIRIGENIPVFSSVVLFLCQVIASQNNIQVRHSYRTTMGRLKNVPRSHHKELRLNLGFY